MKKIYSIIFLYAILVLVGCTTTELTHLSSTSTTTIQSTYNTTTTTTTTTTVATTTVTTIPTNPSPIELYYFDAFGKSGEELKQILHDIIDNHTTISYSTVWTALKETDEDPNNPNNVLLLYSGISRSKDLNGGNVGDWNREHVWPQSYGNFGTSNGEGTDLHHLRPEDVQVNGKRGNLDFDFGGSVYSNCTIYVCKLDGDSFEPDDRVKGDVARMILYMAIRYEGDISGEIDLELNNQTNSSQSGNIAYIGKLSVLLEWHKLDPVDDFERRRNDIIFEKYQHNRNPFIDYPEFADLIWN